MDIRALDGLGRCLTGKLHAKAVGMMGTERGRMLRLYVYGRLRDTYLPFPGKILRERRLGRFCCRGRAVRWRPVLREGRTVRELADVFARGDRNLAELRELLVIGSSAGYGFSSLERRRRPDW